MKAIRVEATGGAEALKLVELPAPEPAEGQILVRVEAAGVNFIDVYQRAGLYPVPAPFTPGQEGAGVVAAVGGGVTGVAVGDRVGWTGALGAYAEFAAIPAGRAVPLPAGITTRQAAAGLLQGMTAQYLASTTFPLRRGDTCLVHAAAGGVGGLLVQLARRRGARVLGTVSTPEKAALAREAGADAVINYLETDFEDETRRLTGGAGVQVVYDSVGRATFLKGLNILAPRGVMVLFGQSSGAVGPIDPQLLNQKGSLFLTRPSLHHYTAARAELLARAAEVLDLVASGQLRLRIDAELPLGEAVEAHRRLESRRTTGKILLLP